MAPVARRLRLTTAAAVLMTCAAPAPPVHADGDPASDVLLGQNTFLPYGGVLPAQLQANVQQAVTDANAASLPLKVAVIASPDDLGAVPQMFGQPQQYASFLYKELVGGPSTYRVHAPAAVAARRSAAKGASRAALLVVMPNGYGVAGAAPAKAQHAVTNTTVNARDGVGLGQATVDGVVKLARNAGHPIAAPPNPLAGEQDAAAQNPLPKPTPKRPSSSGGPPWAAIGAGLGVVLLVALAFAWRRRRRRAGPAESGSG
jgi:hypothetical protein